MKISAAAFSALPLVILSMRRPVVSCYEIVFKNLRRNLVGFIPVPFEPYLICVSVYSTSWEKR
jgi:hypothetical protein